MRRYWNSGKIAWKFKMKSTSLILTVHNKGFLLDNSLNRIKQYTKGNYELIVVLDGCSDDSEGKTLNFIKHNPDIKIKLEYAPDVFETKANNIGLKRAESDYVIIIQDDMLINEDNWNIRLIKPFIQFEDVFAVSANCSHNWLFNPNSIHLGMMQNLNNCWCDIINHVDHAGLAWGLPRDVFAVRQCANRGPLAINHSDLVRLNYFDEIFYPLSMDDHDLCFRARKRLNKIVGCYTISFISDFSWGGTHEGGQHKPWVYEASHRNTRILWERHADIINVTRRIENRKL
jgi:glycosyltransferase involved in cell wall biosynthesis